MLDHVKFRYQLLGTALQAASVFGWDCRSGEHRHGIYGMALAGYVRENFECKDNTFVYDGQEFNINDWCVEMIPKAQELVPTLFDEESVKSLYEELLLMGRMKQGAFDDEFDADLDNPDPEPDWWRNPDKMPEEAVYRKPQPHVHSCANTAMADAFAKAKRAKLAPNI